MTYVITPRPEGTALITVNFADEGVTLQGETTVKGGEPEAAAYLLVFERDLRRNYAELFPVPPIPIPPEGGMIP